MKLAQLKGPMPRRRRGGTEPAHPAPPYSPGHVALTIFTPTCNRAESLERLFRSIAKQAPADACVEWLVIDDGLSDDTPARLAAFADERPDLVRYMRIPNGGKHRAINQAARAARGDWVLIIDSDDLLGAGALADIQRTLGQWDRCEQVGVLRGLRRAPSAAAHGQPHFRVPRNPGSHAEWVSAQRSFDTAEVIRRSALLAHPFPEHAGEHFMAESWLWHALDTSHEVHFVDRAWVDGFHRDGDLNARLSTPYIHAPLGAMDVCTAIYQSGARWSIRACAAVNWWRYQFHARSRDVRISSQPAISSWFAPAGWIVSWNDRRRLKP